MNRILVLEPPTSGAPSGGSLYNKKLVEAGSAIDLKYVHAEALGDFLDRNGGMELRHEAGGLKPYRSVWPKVWMDSLYFYSPHIEAMRQQEWWLRAFSPGRPKTADPIPAGLILHGTPHSLMSAETLGRFSRIVCTSKNAAINVRSEFSLSAAVLYPGWDDPELPHKEPLPLPPHQPDVKNPFILTVAHWHKDKGFLEMGRVISLLHEADPDRAWEWHICGTPDNAVVTEVKHILGPALPRMRLLGPCDRAALFRKYKAASVALLLSRYETYSIATQEAAIFGIPQVISGAGGMQEAAERGIRARISKGGAPGHTFVSTDLNLCTQALQKILEDGSPIDNPNIPNHEALDLGDASWAGRSLRFVSGTPDWEVPVL